MPRHSLKIAFGLLALAISATAQLAHKGPAANIALSKTVQPFDVVSVKQNISGADNFDMRFGDSGFTGTNIPLDSIMQLAYDVKPDYIVGLSGSVASAHFDIEAKVLPQGGSAPKQTPEQFSARLILLLADRFHFKVHVQSQTKPVYDLVLAKGGAKFKLSQDDVTDSSWNTAFEDTRKLLTSKNATMSDLAAALSDQVGRKVIDKTGLTGHADITLKWSDDVAQTLGGADVISIFTAVEEQLGLKLQPSKGPVDTLVIDHAEMPSAD